MNYETLIAPQREELSKKLFKKHEFQLEIAEQGILDEFISTTKGMTSEEQNKCIELLVNPIWKEHPDYYALFSSDCHHVMDSRDKHPLAITVDPCRGYARVHIKSKKDNLWKSVDIHRCIATLFVTNDDPERKIQVHHINGDQHCNWPWNLKWVTPSEHVRLHFDLGSRVRGENSLFSKTKENTIIEICKYLQSRPDLTFKEIGELTGTTKRVVQHVYDGSSWFHISKDYTPFPPRETNNKRGAIGSKNGVSKHTEDDARLICSYLSDPDYQSSTYHEISKLTGIDESFISLIGVGSSWKHIAENYNLLPRNTSHKRGGSGINNGQAKYTLSQIKQVCDLLQSSYDDKTKISHKKIAEITGVGKECVDLISCGSLWKTVSSGYDWYQQKLINKSANQQ